MHSLRFLLLLLLAALNFATWGQSAGTGLIHPRLAPVGRVVACSYQGAIAVRGLGVDHPIKILTHGEGFDIQPAWSPDGRRLAYINTANFRQGQLQLLAMPESKPIALPAAVRAQGRLYFHPDGNRLLGRLSKTGFPGALSWVNLKTSELQPVKIEGLDSSKLAAWNLCYALLPDGRTIALATNHDLRGEQGGNNGPRNDLWLVPAAGGKAKRLTRFPARIYGMEAAPDGKSLFVVTDLGNAYNDIWRVPLREPLRGMRQVTQGQADEATPSAVSRGGVETLLFADNQQGVTGLRIKSIRPDRPDETRMPTGFRLEPAPGTSLKLKVVDAAGKPVAARVSVKHEGGKFHAPAGALYRINGGRMHFYTRGEATLDVPPGKFTIIAQRGTEYRAAETTVALKKDASETTTVTLEQWAEPAKANWFSGENHIHANYGYGEWHVTPREMLLMAEGEGLNVSNVMVANSDGDGVFDRRYFRGRPSSLSTADTILYWNQEYRSTIWGHMTFIHLEQLVEPVFTGFQHTTNPFDVPTNADSAAAATIRNGVVSYTHPASNRADPYATAYAAKGLPVDAALGRIDTMDVMGFGYEASVPLWYRLLNCGFRLSATAGTDCFLNRITSWPPGWGRTYVYCPDGFNYVAWAAGQKDGRTFITTGPMLDLKISDKFAPGDTIKLGPGKVKVQARATSQFPMDQAELVINGKVVRQLKLADDKLSASLDGVVRLDTTGWMALRASGKPASLLTAPGLWAHTSPVYIDIPNRPINAKTDAAYFLKWIDRLEADLRKRNRIPGGIDQHVKIQLNQARAIYRVLR